MLISKQKEIYLYRHPISANTVFTCKQCLMGEYFSPDSDEMYYHWKKQYYGHGLRKQKQSFKLKLP